MYGAATAAGTVYPIFFCPRRSLLCQTYIMTAKVNTKNTLFIHLTAAATTAETRIQGIYGIYTYIYVAYCRRCRVEMDACASGLGRAARVYFDENKYYGFFPYFSRSRDGWTKVRTKESRVGESTSTSLAAGPAHVRVFSRIYYCNNDNSHVARR